MPVHLDCLNTGQFTEQQIKNVFLDISQLVCADPGGRSNTSKSIMEMVELTRYRILEFCNTNVNDYAVVFTSGSAHALKMIAECFDWTPCELCKNRVSSRAAMPTITTPLGAKGVTYKVHSDEVIQVPAFGFLSDNTHSVLGMRQNAKAVNANIYCLTEHNVLAFFDAFVPPQSRNYKPVQRASTVNLTESGDEAKEATNEKTGVDESCRCPSLFVMPAQSNFCGRKYPLDWISMVQKGALCSSGEWFVCLDAESFAPTSPIDLSEIQPDFISFSFRKIFGFPTGLGALLIRRSALHVLVKKTFTSGTVDIALPSMDFWVSRKEPPAK